MEILQRSGCSAPPALTCFCSFLLLSSLLNADGGVTFTDIAADPTAGLAYSRAPSSRLDVLQAAYADGTISISTEYLAAPFKPHGAPGVALFDFDADGDLDLYVTNGPGAPNRLFSNQWAQSGEIRFIERGIEAGVDATEQDSQGVCAGDLDNDGDTDLYVLGYGGDNLLFENLGTGSFAEITAFAGVGGAQRTATSCALGDVNGDGLLDIAVANAFDFAEQLPFTVEPLALNQHNQLFLNQGGNSFIDVSATSGIEALSGIPEPGAALVSWAVSLVDRDLDGDLDLLFSEDGRAFLGTGVTGFNRLFENDGSGHFTDVTAAAGLDREGAWKGSSWGDLNCDGTLDLFASNFGDYILFPGIFPPGFVSSAWFLQDADGAFSNPGPGALVTVPQGWSNAILDYDNDADLDLVVYGGQDTPLFIDESNPGVVLSNEGGCSGQFSWDVEANPDLDREILRNAEALAAGDLNADGFVDLVTVSSFDLPADAPLAPMFGNPLGSLFDLTGLGVFSTVPSDDPDLFLVLWNDRQPGSLTVGINSGGNGNGSVAVRTRGMSGRMPGAVTNRDGIGAVVSFLRAPGTAGTTVTQPVVAGSGAASQSSLSLHFGTATSRRGLVEVLWPGGVRNRLYGVRAGDSVLFPEIPCSYADAWPDVASYIACAARSLDRIYLAGILDGAQRDRFLVSAIQAYFLHRGMPF